MAAKKKTPVDPLAGASLVLDGRVVTMNGTFRVIDKGRVYISDGVIRAVSEASTAPPAEFADAPIIKTAGTLFPGLIELHNHLSYNALQLWQVPRVFAHRGQWSSHPDKRRLISQPMSVLAGVGGMIEALVRYVEAKCLVAGVTTSQGLTLMADPGIEHQYRGVVRNVEATDDELLPEALTRIADVENAKDFKKRLDKASKTAMILHLAEGIGEQARKHFLNLQLPDKSWAISSSLIGIHSAGLADKDFDVMAENGGSIVWSPLSNLLLYAGTCDVKRAKQAGVTLALGSDWSPSGSKNLLSELKVARAFSESAGGIFSPRELVAMATINPARMLKWDGVLGSIAPDRRADILVLKGRAGDPYEQLLKALEDDIQLVFINGVARFGHKAKMAEATTKLVPAASALLEERKLNGTATSFNFVPLVPDPLISQVPLAEAERRLTQGLRDLPNIASGLADPAVASVLLGVLGATTADAPVRRWTLALDNEPEGGSAFEGTERPLAPWHDETADPFGGDALAFNAGAAANLISMTLDRLTIVEDDDYFERLGQETNLANGFAAAVAKLHGASIPAAPSGKVTALPPVSDSPEQASAALPRSLTELAALRDALKPADRIALVEELRTTLEDFYVHLPLKRAAHAVDPLQRLRLLQYALESDGSAAALQGLEFHKQLLAIFTELRDLHTQYLLPPPFNELTVTLPFLLETCYEEQENSRRPVHLVTKVAEALKHPSFKPGVEILFWNGMPIETAVQQNADRQAGSNLAARIARGLASMTVRPLANSLPPLEQWVLLTYRAADGRLLEIRLPWQIRSETKSGAFELPPLSAQGVHAAVKQTHALTRSRRRSGGKSPLGALCSLALDVQMDAINVARRDLYATAVPARRKASQTRSRSADRDLQTRMPTVLRARIVNTPSGPTGYLRIFTFNVHDADELVAEVVRLLKEMPKTGVILDVRNNGGGLIWAAEQLLQLFTDRPIEPERAQFIVSTRALVLARANAPSPLDGNLDLTPWIESMSQAVMTAAVHSEAFPITPTERANRVGRQYKGPVALITDALAYSATDMFTAGFRDHQLGPIIGVDDNTGAGGANVWSYSLLKNLLNPNAKSVPTLPGGCDLRIAIRRTLRVGASSGTPLEDLGVVPDSRHFLTRKDVLEQNQDLIAHAAATLRDGPVRKGRSSPRRR